MKTRTLLLALCAVPALLLGGCARNVGNTVSNAASALGGAASSLGSRIESGASRIESNTDSALTSDRDSSSRHDDPSVDSSSTVDSGTDGFIGDEESGANSGDVSSDSSADGASSHVSD